MRRSVLALVATLAVAVGGCGSSTPTRPPDRVAPHRAASPADRARAEADRLIALVQAPPTATPRDASPAKPLDGASQIPGTDDIVDEHRWWTVSSDAQTTLDWFRNHGVGHLTSSGSGTSGGPDGVTLFSLEFTDRPIDGINSAEVLVGVAPMPDGTSAVRADAQVVWLPARSAAESIPPNVDRIAVSAYINVNDLLGHRMLTGAKARHLAKIINALPTALRGESSCAADQGYRLHVVAGALVFDEDVACSDIAVTDSGKSLPVLEGSDAFVHAVASSMGLSDYPPR